jgi:hypothetical protein
LSKLDLPGFSTPPGGQHIGLASRSPASGGDCGTSGMRVRCQVEVEILTAAEFFDQIASSPPAARELIRRLSQRLREADDRISMTNDETAEHL